MGGEYLNKEENVENYGPSLLVFVRHASTIRNVAKGRSPQFYDRKSLESVRGISTSEEPLSEEGKVQAKNLGVLLKQNYTYFDCIYHPGHLYTQQTVDGILSAFNEKLDIRTEFLLRKRDQGFVYDMLDEDIERQFPWLRDYWQTFGLFFGRAPGSESLIQIAHRAKYFLDNLFRDEQRSSVLVVTHAGTLLAARFLIEGWDFRSANELSNIQRPGNCAIVAYGSLGSENKISVGNESPSFISSGY